MAYLLVASLAVGQAAPMGTALTYQGLLDFNGNPVTDTRDFGFVLWDRVGPGPVDVGSDRVDGVEVAAGLFTVKVDFGTGAFNGDARRLELYVCCATGFCPLWEDLVILSEWQQVTWKKCSF